MSRFDEVARRVARSAVAADDVFTVRIEKPVRFKPEGSTMNSLWNARAIKMAGYEFVKATMVYDNVSGDWKVEAFFIRGDEHETRAHVFGGFSFGYGGEGPRGLVEFGQVFGLRLDPAKVTSQAYKESMPPRGAVDLEMAFG